MAVTGRTPARSVKQRLEALAQANRVRSARARWKRDAKAGRVDPVEAIKDPPELLVTMRLQAALLALPGFGATKASRVLVKSGCSPSKTLGGLSDRQRRDVLAWIAEYTPGRQTPGR